ncbi:ATP-binding protein [Streptomyces sp. JJ38]|uniref:ATP-binding protein n=1 Tax=Streptomyces sp. JJ38 TaxID=2738128 RepID=UPI0027E1498F|nr:ATP-binding protein [Streptomyces sp. JJ38]
MTPNPASEPASGRVSLAKSPTRRKPAAGRGGPPLDWAATHGPVSGAVSAATGAGALALLGAATGMPAGWPLLVGAAGALGHGIAHSLIRRMTARTLATRATSWLLAGGWTSWAIATDPLSWTAVGTLAALGVGIGAAATNAAVHEEVAEEERLSAQAREAARELSAERRAVAAEWSDRIARVTGVQARVFAVESWASGAGFSLAAELPGDGATWDRIRARARALAADARLPRGCVVHVEEGDVQGRVVLDVPTRNVMADTVSYPSDYGPLSVLTGIPWGLLPHSEPVTLHLREACALILGPPGSGKSTFLDAVLAGFARCTDVLTFVIDLKQGAVGMPWARPYLEAEGLLPPVSGYPAAPQGVRPGVDWIAGTTTEAIVMLQTVLAINKARQAAYQQLMAQANTTLLPVSPRLPQIMVVVDEGAEALSAGPRDKERRRVGELIREGMRTTRAMGIRFVLTAVDGNLSAIGDTQVRKFSPVGVALTSGESAGNNTGKLFPGARIDTGQLNEAGAGVIGNARREGFAPTPFKGWHTTPGMVRDVVIATSNRRPTLDDVSVRAAGDAYAQRWSPERAGWMWNDGLIPATTTDKAPEKDAPGERRPGLNLAYKRREDEADAAVARLMDAIDSRYGTTPEPSPSQAMPETASGHEGPEWLTAAMAAIKDAGAAGMKPGAVADLVGRSRQAVRDALKAAAERGELVYRDNGPHSVYVHPDHA